MGRTELSTYLNNYYSSGDVKTFLDEMKKYQVAKKKSKPTIGGSAYQKTDKHVMINGRNRVVYKAEQRGGQYVKSNGGFSQIPKGTKII